METEINTPESCVIYLIVRTSVLVASHNNLTLINMLKLTILSLKINFG